MLSRAIHFHRWADRGGAGDLWSGRHGDLHRLCTVCRILDRRRHQSRHGQADSSCLTRSTA